MKSTGFLPLQWARRGEWFAVEYRIGRLNVTIERFGGIGAVIGAPATLANLAVWIRANTRMTRAQARYACTTRISEVAIGLAHDQQLAGLFRRWLADPDALEAGGVTQFTFRISQISPVVEQVFAGAEAGVSDPAELDRAWGNIRQLVRSPAGRAVRERQGRLSHRPEFCTFVEPGLQSEQGPAPRPSAIPPD